MYRRRKAKRVTVGRCVIGASAPISVQSMTKTDTRNVDATVRQIRQLEKAGCDLVRLSLRDLEGARALGRIKRAVRIPLIADIHFHKDLALAAIEYGADKIRLNPGNISRDDDLRQILRAARRRRIPIRVGVNSGSLPGAGRRARTPGFVTMVEAAQEYIRRIESLGFSDLVISLKSADVRETIEAYRLIARRCSYPLHLGLTATGLPENGIVKSSVAIGTLLAEGIGDTIRVSLTADPVEEVTAGRRILACLGLARQGIEVISCPTCGRAQVALERVVRLLEERVGTLRTDKRLTVAVMGCEVNGPGEARGADLGIAAGKGVGLLFKHGKPLRKISEKNFVPALVRELKKLV